MTIVKNMFTILPVFIPFALKIKTKAFENLYCHCTDSILIYYSYFLTTNKKIQVYSTNLIHMFISNQFLIRLFSILSFITNVFLIDAKDVIVW